MGVLNNSMWNISSAAAADFYDYQIANSCRFDGNARTTRTLDSTATDRDKYTFSTWFKRSVITSNKYLFSCETNNVNYDKLDFGSDDTIRFTWQRGGASGEVWSLAKYRDPNAWMHIVVQIDTSQSTEANRVKIYINGVQSTLSESRYDGWIDQNEDLELNANSNKFFVSGSDSYDGFPTMYLAQTAGIDGSVVAIGDLGESKNGVWIPKDLSGLTFGANGFLLDYANSSDFGNDVSGNNNDFTDNALSTHDQMKDSPTFGSSSGGGNFCTLNPLNAFSLSESNLAEGNLHGEGGSTGNAIGGNWRNIYATFEIPHSGSWYWEYIPSDTTYSSGGIQTMAAREQGNSHNTDFSFFQTGEFRYNGSGEADTSGISADDIVGVWVNDGEIKVYVNNSLEHTFTQQFVAGSHYFPTQIGSAIGYWNFGADSSFAGQKTSGSAAAADSSGYGDFFYSPKGLALCAGNLATPAADPNDEDGPAKYFSNKIYTGDGATTLAITGLEFQPDFTWIKNRDQADSWCLFDSTRGVTKLLSSDAASAETTDADTLKSFTSDGYTVGADVKVNTSTEKYASFNWKVNGGTTAANTVGDIDTVTQINTTTGCSIVTYTGDGTAGQTLGHGLGSVPECILVKNRSEGDSWAVYHAATGNAAHFLLDTNDAQTTSSAYWHSTTPSTTIWTTGNDGKLNSSSENHVAFLFAGKEGFSRFGSYEGNGAADGPFIYTGFTPALVIWKGVDGARNWITIGNKRETYNQRGTATLFPDTADAEADTGGGAIDFLSNGWKVRNADDKLNQDGETYIFLAFAENPFKYTTAK